MSRIIVVNIAEQRLQLREDSTVLMDVAIATAKNGPGELAGSECTPRGWHKVRAKIGTNEPDTTVVFGRRNTGEVY